MSSVKKILVLLLVAVLVTIGIRYALRTEALCAKVTRGTAVMQIPGSVTVRAEYEMPLFSEVGGLLVSSQLFDGKEVQEGAVLAQIDPSALELEIQKIEIDTEATKKRISVGSQIELELQNAQEGLANAVNLTKQGTFAEAELIKLRRTVQQIELRRDLEKVDNQQHLDLLENLLKVNRLKLQQMTIVARFDGVVAEVLAAGRRGALVGDRTPIARMIATNRTIEAKISEENFAAIALGQPAIVSFLGYENEGTFKAKVSKILPTADPITQRYIVHLTVDIPPEKLIPGLTGEVSIITGEHPNALTIPRRAVFGSQVCVVNGDRIEYRPVKIGFTALNFIEVLSGLKEGEVVVVDQPESFLNGDRVTIKLEGEPKP
jgi:RND family efflux transporter MFP subunit